jgi:hypothetical protein
VIAERQVPRAAAARRFRNECARPVAGVIAERQVPRAAQRLRNECAQPVSSCYCTEDGFVITG